MGVSTTFFHIFFIFSRKKNGAYRIFKHTFENMRKNMRHRRRSLYAIVCHAVIFYRRLPVSALRIGII